MSYTYLAAPYSHPDPAVRQRRVDEVLVVGARLASTGEVVFCPTPHGHALSLAGDLPITHAFWMPQCLAFLRHAQKVKVLMLDGWQASVGIGMEIRAAAVLGIPVEYIEHYVNPLRMQEMATYDDE